MIHIEMKAVLFIFIYSLSCCPVLFSQPSDSINFSALSREQLVDTLLFLSKQYYSVSHDKSSKYANDAMILSENIDYAEGKLKAYVTMGEIYNLSANHVTAMEYFYKALSIAQNKHSQQDIAFAMDKIGSCYQRITDFENALNFYTDALNIYKKLNDRPGIIQSLIHIAASYGMQNECEKAFDIYDQALKMAEEDRDKNQLIVIYNGIGNCYTLTGEYDKSLAAYLRSQEVAREVKDGQKTSSLLNNIGNVYRLKDDSERAIAITREAYDIAASINYKEMMATTLYNLSGIYFQKKDYARSMQYVDRARKEVEELGHVILKIKIWEQYVKLYQTLGQFDKANEYHTLLVEEQNEGQKINNVARIANLQVLYNLADKQQKLQEMESASQRNEQKVKILTVFLLLTSVLSILMFVLWYGKITSIKKARTALLRQQDRKQQAEARENERIRILGEQLETAQEKHRREIEKFTIDKQQTDVQIEQLTLEKQRTAIQLEQMMQEKQALETEVAGKNRELVSMTMQIQQKNELFGKLRNDLLKLKDNPSEQTVTEVIKIIDHSSRLDKDWETFLLHFNNVHTNFFDILQQLCPDLTEKEMKHCAYIRMGLSVKETASLMNISIRAVEKARMKIKTKMDLGTDINLNNHIQRITP